MVTPIITNSIRELKANLNHAEFSKVGYEFIKSSISEYRCVKYGRKTCYFTSVGNVIALEKDNLITLYFSCNSDLICNHREMVAVGIKKNFAIREYSKNTVTSMVADVITIRDLCGAYKVIEEQAGDLLTLPDTNFDFYNDPYIQASNGKFPVGKLIVPCETIRGEEKSLYFESDGFTIKTLYLGRIKYIEDTDLSVLQCTPSIELLAEISADNKIKVLKKKNFNTLSIGTVERIKKIDAFGVYFIIKLIPFFSFFILTSYPKYFNV